MSDENQEQQQEEKKQQEQEQLRTAAKALKAQGFNNEQIAQQLSAKHQRTVDDIKLALDQDDNKEESA
jgi:Holliday junction resolvasome RuvABC DNA-binding subunit